MVRKLARLILAVFVCLSVRLSLRQSQVAVLLKRLNVDSRKQRYTVAKGLCSFSTRKISVQLKRRYPKRRRQVDVG